MILYVINILMMMIERYNALRRLVKINFFLFILWVIVDIDDIEKMNIILKVFYLFGLYFL